MARLWTMVWWDKWGYTASAGLTVGESTPWTSVSYGGNHTPSWTYRGRLERDYLCPWFSNCLRTSNAQELEEAKIVCTEWASRL